MLHWGPADARQLASVVAEVHAGVLPFVEPVGRQGLVGREFRFPDEFQRARRDAPDDVDREFRVLVEVAYGTVDEITKASVRPGRSNLFEAHFQYGADVRFEPRGGAEEPLQVRDRRRLLLGVASHQSAGTAQAGSRHAAVPAIRNGSEPTLRQIGARTRRRRRASRGLPAARRRSRPTALRGLRFRRRAQPRQPRQRSASRGRKSGRGHPTAAQEGRTPEAGRPPSSSKSLSRRSVDRATGVDERLHERFEVLIVECSHPNGHRVEDLPEIGRSGFFRPAHFAERAPAAGDQSKAGLLREAPKLIPERSRQIGAGEDMLETVENDQYPRGYGRKVVEDEAKQLVNVLVLDVEILCDVRAMRLQLALEVLGKTPLEVAVRPDAGMSKIDMHGRQILAGTCLVGVGNVSQQDGLPVVRRTTTDT